MNMVDFAKLRRRGTAVPNSEVDDNSVDDSAAAQELPLHLKHRPKQLADVWGQEAVTKSLSKLLSSKNPGHAYLFTGPAGTGKTTLARILAAEFKCDLNNILEIDAATNSGVDAMRDVTSALRYQGFGETPNRAIIIDECHSLSKQAWQSLLKPVEEPPAHVYIFFCTTETGKVPETIVTRCHNYSLKPLRFDDTMDLLEKVIKEEDMDVDDRIVEMVARACNGSARQALVMLSMVRGCKDEDEAERLLETPFENKEVIDLCRLLVSGQLTWQKLVATLKAMPDMNPESVRIVVVNYLASCLMGAKNDKQVTALLDCLDQFAKPFNVTDKNAPLLLAFGNIIYSGN